MPKVDMSRYVECPECHTWQITLNLCQKCMASRLADEGELPASGIVPYDPFKALNAQKLKETKKTTKPKESEDDKKPTKPKESEDDKKKRMKATAKMGNEAKRMPKVDMSRYVECPVCHTWQITLNPCQKCVARRMAAEGRLPASGIVPYDPFKVYSLEQKAKEKPPKKPKETPEELSEHMRQIAARRNDLRRDNALMKRAPPLIDALKDGEPHYLADLARGHAIPFGVTVTDWCVTRTMIQMGLIEWFKTGPSQNSPVKIWIPPLKIQDAIEYAEGLKNGKNQRR